MEEKDDSFDDFEEPVDRKAEPENHQKADSEKPDDQDDDSFDDFEEPV